MAAEHETLEGILPDSTCGSGLVHDQHASWKNDGRTMEEHSSLSSGALGILSVCLGYMSVYVRPFARFLFSVVEEPTRLG